MKLRRTAGVWLVSLLAGGGAALPAAAAQVPVPAPTAAADEAPLFRVFLKDGSSLVSFGELARVDDRVVFSMPTTASASAPQLQLINIAADSVDWERTGEYAETIRAQRYLATRAEGEYTLLTNEIAQALNDVGATDDPGRRLAIVERARKILAEWPADHYDYKRDEIQQMLATLDEAIASLRAASGASTFDLTFVAAATAPRRFQPVMPPPNAREAIEQTLRAAGLTTSPAERVSLLTVALNSLNAEAANLPADWVARTRTEVTAQITAEVEVDRKYQALSTRLLNLATARARMADVRGVQRVIASIKANDVLLGSRRPDAVLSMQAAIEAQLEEARRLRLERDRWALRAPDLRAYRYAMGLSLDRLRRLMPLLEDIKALAGSGPDQIGTILRATEQIKKALVGITPPVEVHDAHALFVSAVQLTENAAIVRREAAINGSMARAWDASSAAAGALMLAARAQSEIDLALRPPQSAR